MKNFADKDGKVWLGGGGRNPPPDTPHLVVTTPEIEALHPKSPMKNQQQMQHQSMTTANSSNKRPAENSPQNNNNSQNVNQEASSSNIPNSGPWVSPMENFPGRKDGHMISANRLFDMYGYNADFRQTNTEFL